MIDGRMQQSGQTLMPFHRRAEPGEMQRILVKFLTHSIDSQKEIDLETHLK